MTSKEVAVETDLSIRRLLARYCHLVDDRDFDAAADLFAGDARFRVLDTDLAGRDAIRSWFDSIPAGMFHHVTNIVVSNASHPDTYHAVSDLVAGAKTDSGGWTTWMHGRYHDTIVGGSFADRAGGGHKLCFTQRIMTAR